MTKDTYKIIKEFEKMKGDFGNALETLVICLIETSFNRHKSDEVKIMFPHQLILTDKTSRTRMSITLINGIHFTKRITKDDNGLVEDTAYVIELLNEDDDTWGYFNELRIPAKLEVLEKLVRIAKSE